MSAQKAAMNCAELKRTARAVQFGAYSQKLNCAQSRRHQTERQTAQTLRSEGPHTVPPWGWGTCGGQAEGKSRTQARIRAGGG